MQVREMAKVLYEAGLNIDYFPTNFIVQDEKIFYIDYECNNYMDEWNFENWGIKYWSKTQEFIMAAMPFVTFGIVLAIVCVYNNWKEQKKAQGED